MRGAESLMLAGLVALIGLGLWQGRNFLPALRSGAQTLIGKHATAKVPVPEKAKPEQKTAHKGRSRAGKGSNPSAPEGPDGMHPENVIVVDVPNPPNPSPENLRPGTTRSALREQYGTPTLDVTARQHGQLVERYYYLGKSSGQFTVATLQDGKVVSTEAVPY